MEPSPKPHWITLLPLPRYGLAQVVKTPISTTSSTASKVAATSAAIVSDDYAGLKWLEHGAKIWDRLWSYATPLPFSTPEVGAPMDDFFYRAWECPNVPEQKPAGYDLAESKVYSLLAANQSQDGMIPLCNNEDVRLVGTTHIYQVLNLFLQMRYTNKLLEPIQPNPGRPNIVQLTFLTPTNPGGLTQAQAAATRGIFYPCWTSTVKQNLTNGDSKRASGYADRILLLEPKAVIGMPQEVAGRTNVAFSELKPFWTYPTTSFGNFLNGIRQVLNAENGEVRIDEAAAEGQFKPTTNLLRQLWGQSHFLGSQIGFVSNLHGVMVLLKDRTPGRSSFVMSSILPWTDPRLLTCLIGLSFIAIDADQWKAANPALTLVNMLAPQGQADPVLQHLPERRFVLPQRFQNAPLEERVAEQIQMAARAAAGVLPAPDVPVPNFLGNGEEDDDEYQEEDEDGEDDDGDYDDNQEEEEEDD